MNIKIDRVLNQRPVLSMLILSGLMGLCFGLSRATWQNSVEVAQVLAGVIRYPLDNPQYIYSIKACSLINDLSAVLLLVTGSEMMASIIISGLLGMISFQALAMVIFTVNRDIYISLMGVLFIYLMNYIGKGVSYPIHFLGILYTYGVIGPFFSILVIALLGAGEYRSGFFILGLLPFVHAAWAVWIWAVLFGAALFDIKFFIKILKEFYPYFLGGLLISLAGAGYHLYLMRDLPVIEPAVKRQYLLNFIRHWDFHRLKFYWDYEHGTLSFAKPGIMIGLYSVVIGFFGLKQFKESPQVSLFLRIIVLSGILSLCAGAVTHLPLENIPMSFLLLIPGRFVNLSNIVCAALLVGIFTSTSMRKHKINYFVFMGVVVLNAVLFLHQPFVAGISAGVLFCWFFYVVVIGGRRQSEERFITKTAGGFFQGGVRYRATLLGIMIVFLLIHLPNKGLNKALGFQQRKFLDRTRSDFLDRMGKREGMMLITTEFNNISLKTRRPVLLRPGQLDTLIYAPESSLIMDRLLKKIYGVDLFNPPETAKVYKGEVRSLVYKTLWENRTLSE